MKVDEREGRSKNDVGRRTKGNGAGSFHDTIRTWRCVASTKGAGLARRGNSAVHRRSPSIRVYVREQQNPGERERAGGREGSRKTRVNGPHSTAYKLQIRQAR